MFLIGLKGKKGVGKNFVAGCIREFTLDHSSPSISCYEEAAYAAPLKEFCISVLGLPREACYGSDADKIVPTKYKWKDMPSFITEKYPDKSGFMTVRDVLQIFGTDFIRECWDTEAWVSALERKIQASHADVFVITDVRFQNEGDLIHRMGGRIWEIDGPPRGTSGDKHSSETSIDGIRADAYVRNHLDDTRASITSQVDVFIRSWASDRGLTLAPACRTT